MGPRTLACQVRVQGHAYLHFQLPKMEIQTSPDSGLPGQGPRPCIFALPAPKAENTHIPGLWPAKSESKVALSAPRNENARFPGLLVCQVKVQGHVYLHFQPPNMKIRTSPDSVLPSQSSRPCIFAHSAPKNGNTHL